MRRFAGVWTSVLRRFDRHLALGLVLGASLLVLGAVTWALGVLVNDVAAPEVLAGVDRPVLHFFVHHRQAALTSAMRVVTDLGSSALLIPLVAAVAATLRWRGRRWRVGVLVAAAYGGTAALSTIVKHLVGRPRPPAADRLSEATGFAFPSGHATHAAAVYVALAAIAVSALPRHDLRRAAAAVGAGLVVAAVGVSRLYLGVHWLTDVVAGWLLGALWTLVLFAALRGAARTDTPSRVDASPAR